MPWVRDKLTGQTTFVEDRMATVPVGRPNTTAPYEVPRAEAELAIKRGQAGAAAFDPAQAAAQARKTAAEAAKIEADRIAEAKKVADAARRSEIQKSLSNDDILKAIGGAREKISGWSTGVPGQILNNVWGTDAADLSGLLTTVGGNTMLTRMQELKDASPTGATGLGQQTEREGQALRNSIAPIEQGQSAKQLKDSLDQVERHYRRFMALTHGENPDNPEVAKTFGIPVDEPFAKASPQQAAQILARSQAELNRRIAGAPPAARKRALDTFNKDPEVLMLRKRMQNQTLANAPRKASGGAVPLDEYLSRHGGR